MHDGHRQRLRQRFQTEGLSGFDEHQVLELLLFYAIPRKDTNELAHVILDKFGNLKNLFEADVADITNIPGVGENAASLIRLIPDIAARYWFSGGEKNLQITSIDSAANYIKSLLYGKPMEYFYVVCLDSSYRVKRTECLSKGTPSETPVYVRHIIEAAIRSGTDKIMVAHNHPSGNPQPSKKDIEVTLSIVSAMQALEIEFADHIIIAGDDYYSFAAQQLLKSNFSKDAARAAHYSVGVMNSPDPDAF